MDMCNSIALYYKKKSKENSDLATCGLTISRGLLPRLFINIYSSTCPPPHRPRPRDQAPPRPPQHPQVPPQPYRDSLLIATPSRPAGREGGANPTTDPSIAPTAQPGRSPGSPHSLRPPRSPLRPPLTRAGPGDGGRGGGAAAASLRAAASRLAARRRRRHFGEGAERRAPPTGGGGGMGKGERRERRWAPCCGVGLAAMFSSGTHSLAVTAPGTRWVPGEGQVPVLSLPSWWQFPQCACVTTPEPLSHHHVLTGSWLCFPQGLGFWVAVPAAVGSTVKSEILLLRELLCD